MDIKKINKLAEETQSINNKNKKLCQ